MLKDKDGRENPFNSFTSLVSNPLCFIILTPSLPGPLSILAFAKLQRSKVERGRGRGISLTKKALYINSRQSTLFTSHTTIPTPPAFPNLSLPSPQTPDHAHPL